MIVSKIIPVFPEFMPITLEMRPDIRSLLSKIPDGVSEFTFSNLFLFRKRYGYEVSMVRDKTLVITGRRGDRSFFMTPCAAPGRSVLMELFDRCGYWKCIPDSVLAPCRACLECRGLDITEDRDNFDYLYLRSNLAELPGKKYHKKRNLVNAFENVYSCTTRPLDVATAEDALAVLDQWRIGKEIDGDYEAAREALELSDRLEMRGLVYYIGEKPVAWCLGEELARGKMFAVHFEKAVDGYKGLYQFVNRTFAASLPDTVRFINREQDLGNDGLRQAKMSYRPSGFVRKYQGRKTCGSTIGGMEEER